MLFRSIIMNIGESASVAWTKEQLIGWLESNIPSCRVRQYLRFISNAIFFMEGS